MKEEDKLINLWINNTITLLLPFKLVVKKREQKKYHESWNRIKWNENVKVDNGNENGQFKCDGKTIKKDQTENKK